MDKLKLDKLRKYIKKLESAAVAFSGGVDSTLLAKIAREELGEKSIAITISGPQHSKSEIKEAKEFAESIGINHKIIEMKSIENEELIYNPENRCYICKKDVFTKIKGEARRHGIKNVLDGTNLDDLSDYRPGLKALEELNIISPLKEVGLTKIDIREISKELNLPTWNKAAFACLITRIPYGEKLTNEKLTMVEAAENYIKSLGFNQYRVRNHDGIARIEVEKKDLPRFFDVEFMKKISDKLKEIGFKYVTLDLEGYKMGKMNDEIKK